VPKSFFMNWTPIDLVLGIQWLGLER